MADHQMARDTILEDLRQFSARDFVSAHLFDRTPFVFPTRQSFINWKKSLGKTIDVDPAAILLVGSAAIGVSMNPDRSFKAFDLDSDVDVAVVSNYHFTAAWRYLRNNGHKRSSLPQRQQIAWDDHVKRLIYWGTIATDKLLPLMPFAKAWMSASAAASRSAEIANREIRFRIYADYESLRSYQVMSTKRAQAALLAGME
jgi:hypothetical protein